MKPVKSKMKMPKLVFEPAGKIFPGSPPSYPSPRTNAQHKLWQAWHRYGRIKLAAAVGGDVSSERDARVYALWAKRGSKTVAEISRAAAELHAINESLSEFHEVIITHKLVEDALAILSPTRRAKPVKYVPYKLTAAEKRERQRKREFHKRWVAEVNKMTQCQCPVHFDAENCELCARLKPREKCHLHRGVDS
jgi:hypothetical protein